MKTATEPNTDLMVAQASEITAQVEAMFVDDDQTYAIAKEHALAAKDLKKQIEDFYAEPVKKAHEAHKALTKQRSELLAPIKKIMDIVSLKTGAYHERLQREAEEEARIAAALAEKEREEEIEATADALLKVGNTAAAAEHLRNKEHLPSIHVVPEVHKPEAATGGTTRTTWKFEIVDKKAIPRDYLMPDEKAIRAMVNAKKGDTEIPGVRVYSETKHHV